MAIRDILLQRVEPTAAMHSVAVYYSKLSPAESNYHVGDRELLAIKSALKSGGTSLEGATHPMLGDTDHKNLEYLRAAKQLRPCQLM